MKYLEINRKTYDETAKEFGKKIPVRKNSVTKIVKRFFPFLKKKGGSLDILDIGLGNGQIARKFHDLGCRVTGIEFSEPMAEIAKKTAPDINIICDDFLNHNFGNKKFSGILAVAFIHLFPEKDCKMVLKKIHHLLEKGGHAFISTTKSNKSEEGFFGKENFQNQPLRFRKRFTKKELWNMLEKADFEILEYNEDKDKEVSDKIWMNFIIKLKNN